jgi:putative ABC transport system ATP-binding protein
MLTTQDDTVIETSHLQKRIAGPGGILTILRDVELQVNAGEAVAILGASGSGKTTLLGLLAGLDTPTSGVIKMFDSDLSALNEDGRAALRAGRVGFVFQSFQLLPGLTALENVMLALELGGNLPQAKQIALDTIAQVGLSERADHYPDQLSGGEQQRVAIARAFAAKPQILFADEPTGNLDQHTGRQIIDLLFSLKDVHNTALVLVTHDVELADRCSHHWLLDEGMLKAQ